MNDKLMALYQKAHHAYQDLHPLIEEIRKEMETYSMEDLADASAVMHRSGQWLNEMRKKIEGYKSFSDRLACLIFLTKIDKHGRPVKSIKTKYCTATPRIKYVPKIPRKDRSPEEFAAFMKYLGVSDEAIEFESVRPHWPGVVDLCGFLAAEGKPSPPGVQVSENSAEYALTIRLIKNLEEERVKSQERTDIRIKDDEA